MKAPRWGASFFSFNPSSQKTKYHRKHLTLQTKKHHKQQMIKHLANIITSLRIFCSILMIFYPVFSLQFYITYLVCGISDMIDGAVARATNNNTKFGEQLDSIADIIFIIAASIKLLPIIHIPNWLWIWITIIAIIKTGNVALKFYLTKKLIFSHTITNKITGLSLFILPLTLSFIEIKYSAAITCFIATFAAIQEGRER